MEELCFFVKSIDNSRLVRVVDPHSRRQCLGLVASVLAMFVIVLLYAVPYLGKFRSGYRIEDLKREHEALVESGRQLKVKEAALRDPQRIYSIASKLGLSAPAPEQVVWSESGSARPDLLARNAAGGGGSGR